MPRSKSKRRRYQPPPKKKPKPSPRWLGPTILTVLLVGVAVIVLNYLGVDEILPGSPRNLYLWSGLGAIAVGFGLATQWR
ncbi:MAG TPA: cell division protein CrgA [Actinomycetota bacterium]|nr:cell division protein CrgA [Actinomycetota bacterium]